MSLDIFFLGDIRNALLAANEASSATAAKTVKAFEGAAVSESGIALVRAYREGYKAALMTMALAFGLSPSIIKWRTVNDQEEACTGVLVSGRR